MVKGTLPARAVTIHVSDSSSLDLVVGNASIQESLCRCLDSVAVVVTLATGLVKLCGADTNDCKSAPDSSLQLTVCLARSVNHVCASERWMRCKKEMLTD